MIIKRALVVYGSILVLALWTVFWFIYLMPNRSVVVSLIVVKLPRSGSSWFTESLNDKHYVYIAKEIVQTNESKALSGKRLETHLHSALLSAEDKAIASNQWLPTGRYLEDYWWRMKFLNRLDFVGFSLNLEHVKGTVLLCSTAIAYS